MGATKLAQENHDNPWENTLIDFRHYWADGGGPVFEARRKGFDPASIQMQELYEFMAKVVPHIRHEIEVVLTVRAAEY